MRRLLALLVLALPWVGHAQEYASTLVVQTGHWRESDLVVRNISDLASKKTCLAFYVRTTGTSPVMTCYDALRGFGANIIQVGHVKENDLVIRKVQDVTNNVACLVAYVSTPGTSPSIDCYPGGSPAKGMILQEGHLREGDLDVRKILDPDGQRACLVAYVATKGTAPSVACYDMKEAGQGGLQQVSYLREGDLVVRKIFDVGNGRACLITYVSTQGTSARFYCYSEAEAPLTTTIVPVPQR